MREGSETLRPRLMFAAVWTILIVLAGGCDWISGSDQGFADEGRVLIDGSSTVPLLLVTSTNFLQGFDPLSGETVTTILSADTITLNQLPTDQRYPLSGKDRFLARIANPSTGATATIHMQVRMDGRQVFDQHATLLDASLEYTVFYSPR